MGPMLADMGPGPGPMGPKWPVIWAQGPMGPMGPIIWAQGPMGPIMADIFSIKWRLFDVLVDFSGNPFFQKCRDTSLLHFLAKGLPKNPNI